MSDTIRTYEIITASERLRMEIPEDWKVTFGPVTPSSKGSYGGGANALRIYEDTTKQRAIFLDVLSFRDLSVPIKRLVVREKGTEKWHSDENGRGRKTNVEYDRQWIADEGAEA